MKLLQVSLEDFGSYHSETVDFSQFDEDEPVLIIGDNKDSSGANSNGSGKSTLLHAVAWALFGKTPGKGSADSVINEQAESCQVTVCLTDNSNVLDITRRRGKHKGLKWSIDGELQKYSTSTDSQHALMRRLGYQPRTGFSDFMNSSFFSSEAAAAFTSQTGGSEERMAVIARFIGLDILDKAKDLARGHRSETRGELKAVREAVTSSVDEYDADLLNSVRDQVEIANEALRNLRENQSQTSEALHVGRKRDSVQGKLREATVALKGIDGKFEALDVQLERQIQSTSLSLGPLANELEELSQQLAEAEIIEMEYLEDAKEQVTTTVGELSTRMVKTNERIKNQDTMIARLEAQMAKAQECPECNTPLQIDVEGKIACFDHGEMQGIVDRETEVRGQLQERLAGLRETRDELREGREEIEAQIVTMRQLEKLGERKQALQLSIEDKSNQVEEHIQERKGLAQRLDTESRHLQKEVKALEAQLKDYLEIPETRSLIKQGETISRQIQETQDATESARRTITQQEMINQRLIRNRLKLKVLETKHEGIDFWADGFPIIRKWQIDRFIPEFEGAVNRTLSTMDTGMRVELSTTKKAKRSRDGEDTSRAGFNLDVYSDRGSGREFETFSQGESHRIGVAVAFSLREVTLDRGTNALRFLMIDELVDSLDELGIEAFFRLLPTLSGLKLVISHDPALASRFNNVIRVVKQDGLTTIA